MDLYKIKENKNSAIINSQPYKNIDNGLKSDLNFEKIDKNFYELINVYLEYLFKLSELIKILILEIPKQENKNEKELLIIKERGKKVIAQPKNHFLNLQRIEQLKRENLNRYPQHNNFFMIPMEISFFNKIEDPKASKKIIPLKNIIIKKFETKQKINFLLIIIVDCTELPKFQILNKIAKYTNIFSYAIDDFCVINQLLKINALFEKSLANILELLISLLEVKDPYTFGHSNNVKEISLLIADELNLSQEVKKNIEIAAILHDIGKIGISDLILQKPDILNNIEFEEVKKHSLKGALLLAHIPKFKHIAKIIIQHHERYDGKGYPISLFGEKILIESRIIAVADAFDAITSKRPYRDKMDESKAVEIIKSESGKQFDPIVVEALLKVVENKKLTKKIYDKVKA